jgi:hypothetical protein
VFAGVNELQGADVGPMRTRRRAALGITFSLVVLGALIVFSVFGGTSEQSQPRVEVLGTGHSVEFSPTAISVSEANGSCSSQRGVWYWRNDTGTTQQVVQIAGPNPSDVILPVKRVIGECPRPGTYIFSLTSNPGARLVVTVDYS